MRRRLVVAALSTIGSLALLEAVGRYGLPLGLFPARLGHPPELIEQVREFLLAGEPARQVEDSHVVYRLKGPGVNGLGFRDAPFHVEKTAGSVRIACIGASTTEGKNGVSYPDHLQRILDQRSHSTEVMNWGVSGWTSAESLTNYVLLVQDYRPDVVLIHHAVNDVSPRVWPGFRSDYSHYRVPWRQPRVTVWGRWLAEWSELWVALQVQRCLALAVDRFAVRPLPAGVQQDVAALADVPPDTFDRNIRTLCEAVRRHGGTPMLLTMPLQPERGPRTTTAWRRVGAEEHNEVLRRIAREERLGLVDLAKRFAEQSDRLGSEFVDLVHLTGEGMRVKAVMTAGVLERRGLVAGPP